jgi:hypothetical protein
MTKLTFHTNMSKSHESHTLASLAYTCTMLHYTDSLTHSRWVTIQKWYSIFLSSCNIRTLPFCPTFCFIVRSSSILNKVSSLVAINMAYSTTHNFLQPLKIMTSWKEEAGKTRKGTDRRESQILHLKIHTLHLKFFLHIFNHLHDK